jgi:predicted Zn-dependent peptidase
MASIDGKAETLGSFAVFHGDYESLFGLTERIGNVSNVQIRNVAARIFRPRNATIGVLYPAEPDAADEPAQGSPE